MSILIKVIPLQIIPMHFSNMLIISNIKCVIFLVFSINLYLKVHLYTILEVIFVGGPGRRMYDSRSVVEESPAIKSQKFCYWCKKPLSHRPILHNNKHHEPEIIKFCSKDCHNAWCYEQSKKC